MACQRRIKPLGPVLGQHRESPALVALHEARIADDIQRHYGGQFTPLLCQSSCPFVVWTIVDRTINQGNGTCNDRPAQDGDPVARLAKARTRT